MQWSWLPIPVAAFLAVITTIVWKGLEAAGESTLGAAISGAISLAVIIVVLLFSRLEVTVGIDALEASFGFGWPRRTVVLSDITSVGVVRNRWWYGWGIRWVPNGSMYNVWGLDAVELGVGDGRVFRVGTADPVGLATELAGRTGLAVIG